MYYCFSLSSVLLELENPLLILSLPLLILPYNNDRWIVGSCCSVSYGITFGKISFASIFLYLTLPSSRISELTCFYLCAVYKTVEDFLTLPS